MKIYRSLTLDMETGAILCEDSFDYSGPLALAKGAAAGNDVANQRLAGSWASPLEQQSQSIQSTLLPFFNQEMLNPQGFNPQTMGEMNTAGGQVASGQVGQAAQAAKLAGARTGNLAGTNAAIDQAARNGMQAETGNALNVNLANQKLKTAQQQAGVSGLSGLTSEDIQAALNSINASSGASNAWSSANNSAWGPFESILSAGSKIAGAAAGNPNGAFGG